VCAGYAASCLLKFTHIFLTSEEVTDVPKRPQPTMKLRCFNTMAKAGYLPPSLVVFQYSTVQNKDPQPSRAYSWRKLTFRKVLAERCGKDSPRYRFPTNFCKPHFLTSRVRSARMLHAPGECYRQSSQQTALPTHHLCHTAVQFSQPLQANVSMY
jgi:hypothetical protein